MQQLRLSPKQILQIITLLFFIILIYVIFNTISRFGKEKVSIDVIPSDANLYIDGKKINSGDNYIKKGKYKFSVKKEGFKSVNQTITIPKGGVDVGFVPDPISNEAKKWLQDNPRIQRNRESIGGEMASLTGSYIEENTPIISNLPYADAVAPFSINYGGSTSREYGVFIVIGNSVPQSRVEALQYIKQNGSNPTDLEIRYEDFKNPLLGKRVE